MIKPENCVFIDIDTQVDFLNPEGNLYVPDSERLKPAFRNLLSFAREHDIPVVGSVDAHGENDPEFDTFPPHCIRGTQGQKKVPETRFDDIVFIPSDKLSPEELREKTRDATAVYFEKQQLSVVDGNPNFLPYLDSLNRSRAVVFGVTTEYCVREAALGIRNHGYDVRVLADAIEAVDDEDGRKAIKEMKERGITFLSIAEALPQLEEPSQA